jgi:hypothetical protein
MKRTKLNPVSDKRKGQLRIYSYERKAFLAAKPVCEICHRGRSVDVHHRRGRWGRKLLDRTFWTAVCRPCHDLIHSNPRRARELGYLER